MTTKIVQVVDETSTLKLIASNGDYVSIPKSRLKLKYNITSIFLYDEFYRGQAPIQVEDNCYEIVYANITSPVTANVLALANLIVTLMDNQVKNVNKDN
jgi:hypothetical protein